MWKKIIKNKFQLIIVVLMIVGFALIRNYEDLLFYDPFLDFFKSEYTQQSLPNFNEGQLYLNLFLRYFINTIFSLIIIYTLFKKWEFIRVASFLYLFFFVTLMIILVIVLHFFSDRLLLLFYVRRFIIQPLFLLLFVPGFYLQSFELKK